MKYTITGRYDESKNFNTLVEDIKNYISPESINAGCGRFYFESIDVNSRDFSSFEEILNREFQTVSINCKKNKLLEYINENTLDLNEEFTIIKPSQNYYNILKYLEK